MEQQVMTAADVLLDEIEQCIHIASIAGGTDVFHCCDCGFVGDDLAEFLAHGHD